MGVMIVSVIGCLGLMCNVISVQRWCGAGSCDQESDAPCLLLELGHERDLVSMLRCDAKPLAG